MTEQQPHEVVDRPGGFELRRTWWPESRWAARLMRRPDRAFRPLAGSIDGANRSRRQIAMTAPVTQQKAGWEHPERIAMTAPVVRQTAGRPGSHGRPVGFDFGDSQLEHGYNPDRACRTPS